MIPQCLHLSGITDFGEFYRRYILDCIDTACEFQELASCHWTDSWELFEDILFHGFGASGSIRCDRESVWFISGFLEYHEFWCPRIEHDRNRIVREKYLFFSFGDRTDGRYWYLSFLRRRPEGSTLGVQESMLYIFRNLDRYTSLCFTSLRSRWRI